MTMRGIIESFVETMMVHGSEEERRTFRKQAYLIADMPAAYFCRVVCSRANDHYNEALRVVNKKSVEYERAYDKFRSYYITIKFILCVAYRDSNYNFLVDLIQEELKRTDIK